LVGSAILRALYSAGARQVITRSHSELELTDATAVRHFFAENHPEYVFLAAAKVGGILANSIHPAEFISENLSIQNNVIGEAYRCGVRRLLFLGSSCIYPRDCAQPIKEEYLLSGPLERTNRAYAVAKIAGVEMCRSHNQQYGTGFLAAMPTNLYGPNDNYDLNESHVLPALVRKFYEAKQAGARGVTVWGTGRVRREFLHSDDLAEACLFLMSLPESPFSSIVHAELSGPLVNVGFGEDCTIAELAEMIRQTVGFAGEIQYDCSRSEGTPRKLLDNSMLTNLGWKPRITLSEGLTAVCEEYSRRLSLPQADMAHS
jgi:GDP-L-fucose synthase